MATTKSAKKHKPLTLRNSAEAYTIHLTGGPYVLTQTMLQEQAETNLPGKRKWDRPLLKFISYEHDTLKFKVSCYGQEGFVICIHVHPDKLKVSCSCGMRIEKLCIHALKALEKLIVWPGGEGYFEKYKPDGELETGLRYSKFFERKAYDYGPNFIPKKSLGSVYNFSDKISSSPFAGILDLSGPSGERLPQKNREITYILMFSKPHSRRKPLFLLSCFGIKNKKGTNLKFFERFLDRTEQNFQPSLTEGQKLLNDLCYKMWEQAENTTGNLLETEEHDRKNLKQLFNLWEKAVPYLNEQEYVYMHPFYWERYLKGKPSRSYMHRIVIKKERPRLWFHLAEKGNFYQLHLKMDLGGKTVSQFNSDCQFFIEYKGCHYLLASLRDVGILEWMRNMDNRITIFKEHFEEFEKVFLKLLRQYYTIEY